MLTQGPRALQKQRTRGALLEAARTVLGEDGLAGATTRRIAREAGVAHGTVFVHFPSLEALMEELLDEQVGRALEAGQRTLPARAALVPQLVHLCLALYDGYRASPEVSRAAIAASLFQGQAGGPAARRLQAFEAWVTERVRRAVAAGAVPPIDPALAFAAFFSLYFGLLVAGLRGQLDRAGQAALLTEALQRLFRLPPAPAGTARGRR